MTPTGDHGSRSGPQSLSRRTGDRRCPPMSRGTDRGERVPACRRTAGAVGGRSHGSAPGRGSAGGPRSAAGVQLPAVLGQGNRPLMYRTAIKVEAEFTDFEQLSAFPGPPGRPGRRRGGGHHPGTSARTTAAATRTLRAEAVADATARPRRTAHRRRARESRDRRPAGRPGHADRRPARSSAHARPDGRRAHARPAGAGTATRRHRPRSPSRRALSPNSPPSFSAKRPCSYSDTPLRVYKCGRWPGVRERDRAR